MRYTITITKVDVEESIIERAWKVISKDTDNRDVFGYTPEINARRELERKVYEQTVDELDIKAVISAVNKPTRVNGD